MGMNPRAWAGCVALSAGLLLGSRTLASDAKASNDPAKPPTSNGFLYHFAQEVRDDRRLRDFEQYVATVGRSPTYQKVSVSGRLADCLTDRGARKLLGYEWTPGTHDRRLVAGSAAVLIENMYGVKLPPVTTGTGDGELQRVKSVAIQALQGYRAGAVARSKEPGGALALEEVRNRHGRAVRASLLRFAPDLEKVNESVDRFELMLVEWFPIGRAMQDLESIAGAPTYRVADEAGYTFETGLIGTGFKFVLKDGVIDAVFWYGIH
jgi:hypothetical protein